MLVCPGASALRGDDPDQITAELKRLEASILTNKNSKFRMYNLRSADELQYAVKLQGLLSTLKDFDKRVESPWISIYSNSKQDIDSLANISLSNVKYICEPPAGKLAENTIILPKVDFDYKVTMGKTTQNYEAFVGWAETNSKLKLTKGCKKDLSKPRSWGGSYFYLTGDNNLLMAKMHLGSTISKIERIIKA